MCHKLIVMAAASIFSLGFVSHAYAQELTPVPLTDSDYQAGGNHDPSKVELGKSLFFDKILSGNRNISCATCHHALADTGDGLSLPIGEGASGLGVTRDTGEGTDAVYDRVPRNAPPIFNLGANEFRIMFHDGRVAESDHASGFDTPAGDDLPAGLDSALAAQAMFPVTSGTEMAGQAGENSIGDAGAAGDLAGPDGVWAQMARRLRGIPEYVDMFRSAYRDVKKAQDITYVHAANAIAAFEASAWRADNSPFDRYLRSDTSAMSEAAIRGLGLFYGEAGCSECHSGPFQTDQSFHAIAMPQIGPGKGHGDEGYEDYGRGAVTGNEEDRYAFRTPTLRNVALTGPWGHDGAYNSLEGVVRHHLDPVKSLRKYDENQAVLPSREDLDDQDFLATNDAKVRNAIAAANELEPVDLSDKEVADLMDFLNALTDPASIDLRNDVPRQLPSGLPVFD